jgi:Spo0E like sporulation regulatory protein.
MYSKIEIQKKKLYKLLNEDVSLNSQKVLEVSQKLDTLINSFYKNNNSKKSGN